jgi:hypothetical protein
LSLPELQICLDKVHDKVDCLIESNGNLETNDRPLKMAQQMMNMGTIKSDAVNLPTAVASPYSFLPVQQISLP